MATRTTTRITAMTYTAEEFISILKAAAPTDLGITSLPSNGVGVVLSSPGGKSITLTYTRTVKPNAA